MRFANPVEERTSSNSYLLSVCSGQFFLVSGSCGSNLLKREIQKKVAGRTASSACLESEWMRNMALASTLIIGSPSRESKTTAEFFLDSRN